MVAVLAHLGLDAIVVVGVLAVAPLLPIIGRALWWIFEKFTVLLGLHDRVVVPDPLLGIRLLDSLMASDLIVVPGFASSSAIKVFGVRNDLDVDRIGVSL